MRTKTIFKYFILSVVCPTIFSLTGCNKTSKDLAKKTQISEGQFTAQINGLKLWYKVSGKGPVCILPTPGWGPSSELYFMNLTPLEEIFSMVYLDTRGSGRSQRPKLNEYNMSDFVSDIEELIHHLGVNKIWLMGHSNGASIVLNYAFTYPDHVNGLILVDATVGDASKDEELSNRMQLRKGEPWFNAAIEQWKKQPKTQEEFEIYMKTVLPFFFYSVENMDKHRDVFNKMSMSFHALQGQMHSEGSSEDIIPWLSEMDIPTLIIVGIDDFICPPSAAQFLHGEIPNSKLLVIEKAGHFPWMEQPKQFFGGIRNFLPKLRYHIN